MLEIKQLEDKLIAYHSNNKDNYFKDKFEECDFIKNEFNGDYKLLLENVNSDIVYNFQTLSLINLDRAIYQLYHNQIDEMTDSLMLSQSYSSVLMNICSKACGCLETNPFIEMKRAGVLLDLQVLLSNEEQIKESTQILIDSLNAKSCLIRRGDAKAVQSWFSIELLSKVYDIEILKKRTRYPKDFQPYEDVLEKWDTQDLIEVEMSVTFMCIKHLEILRENRTVPNNDPFLYIVGGGIQENGPEFLTLPFIQIVPYEVLAWLKLRELKGLKNPDKYSHGLMNTKVAQMFLNIKERTSTITSLKYTDEVINKLKEKCKDFKG